MFFLIDGQYSCDDVYVWIEKVKMVYKSTTTINHSTKYKIEVNFLTDRSSVSFVFSDRNVRDSWFTKICEGISKPQLTMKG